MLIRSKKADMAITLLVFMAILVAGAASLIFLTSSGQIRDRVIDARFIDEVYLTETELDFYLNDIIENALEKTKSSENFKQDFIIGFKEELVKYKGDEGYILDEFIQIERQISLYEDDVVKYEKGAEESRVIVEFRRIIIGARETAFEVSYTYNRKFEKKF